jgi:membrane protease YdiL (CAAX protease family)
VLVQKFRRWLIEGASFTKFFDNLIWILVACVLVGEVGSIAAGTLFPVGLSDGTVNSKEQALGIFGSVQGIILHAVVLGPIIEEAAFRLLPLGGLTFVLWKISPRFSSQYDIYPVLLALVVTSIYFGLIHGNMGNVLIQGAVGIIFGLVFLKMSYYGEAPFRGFVASTIIHSVLNATAFTGFFLRELLGLAP